MSKPNKKEVIKALIEAGLSFDQIVEKSGAKEQYVKTVFSMLKLDWKEYKDEEISEIESTDDQATTIPVQPDNALPEESESSEVPEVQTELSEGLSELSELNQETESEVNEEEETSEGDSESDEDSSDSEEQQQEAEESEEELRSQEIACLELLRKANNVKLTKRLKAVTLKYRQGVEKALEEQNYTSVTLAALNSRYVMISPRPKRTNSLKEILRLHTNIRKLFLEKNNRLK